MAHFAEINKNKIVLRVLVVPDEQESRGAEYLANDLGLGGQWIQTSFNSTIRKHYAGIGMSYDLTLDAFIPIKPFDSWILNEETCDWIAPLPLPNDIDYFEWNETIQNWELIFTYDEMQSKKQKS